MHLDYSNISERDIQAVSIALTAGQVSTAAPLVRNFEQAMAKRLGVSDAVATNSGSAALHLALLAAGIGPGDEVIVPVLTFAATANVVRYVGARPVFVDVDAETWCIVAENLLGRRGGAIIAVHLYGNLCIMRKITDISKISETVVIEDAAEALGVKDAGIIGDYGCFSFNGNKTMTTGGGGALVAKDSSVAKFIRHISSQAKLDDGTYDAVGYNYRMPALNAALGLSQLYRLDDFLAKKRLFNRIYREELHDLIQFQQATPSSEPSWWYTAGTIPGDEPIEELQKRLKERRVPTRRVFRPLHHSPPFKEFAKGQEFPNAEYIWRRGLCLPCSTLNSEADIRWACQIIRKVIKDAR